MTPPGRTEEYLRTLSELSTNGRFGHLGLPGPLTAARLVRDYGDVGHGAAASLAAQRRAAAVVLAIAGGSRPLRLLLGSVARRIFRAYEFVDEWEVAAPAEAIYAVLADGRTYPAWWRPVYIDVESDGPPTAGSVSLQHFKGRLPYHLHTRSRLVRLEPGRLIEAEVDGDLRGRGIWTLTPIDSGARTHVRFDWTVHADRPLLKLLTPVLRPALRANHNWAIARAIEGLQPYVQARATGARL